MRVEQLIKHLNNLQSVNEHGDYDDDIRNTVDEINKELGIGVDAHLSSYSTKELHEELNTRTAVYELIVDVEQEVNIGITSGDDTENHSYKGPARILINQD